MKKEIPNIVKKIILKLEPSAEILLYGSRARNDFHENSDWAFLILLDGLVDNNRINNICDALYDIELETDEIISSIVRNRQEWNSPKYSVVPLFKNIENEGIRL